MLEATNQRGVQEVNAREQNTPLSRLALLFHFFGGFLQIKTRGFGVFRSRAIPASICFL